MKRRSLLKGLFSLPFLGLLRPQKAEAKPLSYVVPEGAIDLDSLAPSKMCEWQIHEQSVTISGIDRNRSDEAPYSKVSAAKMNAEWDRVIADTNRSLLSREFPSKAS